MQNIKYYKDLNHNFLIINKKIKETEQNYQYRMISGNKIRHLLMCRIRYVDEECSFYYEISSRQNLKNIFEKRPIGYEDLFRLLENIQDALGELEDFLLDSHCLLLGPEYIYADPETKEYFFLYYPCAEEADREKAMQEFADFIVDKVDHEQEETVEIAYKIYEAIQDDVFLLSHILNLFHISESGCGERAGEEDIIVDVGKETDVDFWMDAEEGDTKGENGETGWKTDRGEDMNYLPVVGLLALLCAAAAAAIFGIGYFFTLSREEWILSVAGILFLIPLSAFLFLYFIINISRRKRYGKTGKAKEECVEKGDLHGQAETWYVKENGEGERRQEEKRTTEKRVTGRTMIDKKAADRKVTGRQLMGRDAADFPEEYGNTVFLDASVHQNENKLYGTNKGNKYHIDLEHLPCTIGKMAGNVDVVIKDSTISRIHARFTGEEGRIYVTDMNSTNGTYKNGLRLDPNETVQVERGDELRFGRMTFCYR